MKHWMSVAVVTVLLSLGSVAHAQQGGIQFFEGTWQEALDQAKAEDKLIFVDAYAVWCGPCKWMDANVFTDPAVGEYFNTHFINYKFDMEKGEGPEFAKKYNVRAYPTFLFINAAGEVVHSIRGSRQPGQLIDEGKNALASR